MASKPRESQPDAQQDPLTYTAASRELDAILNEIENGAADIDVLSERVARAAFLIKLCREKLTGTELEVKKVVDDLTAAASADAATPDPDADA